MFIVQATGSSFEEFFLHQKRENGGHKYQARPIIKFSCYLENQFDQNRGIFI